MDLFSIHLNLTYWQVFLNWIVVLKVNGHLVPVLSEIPLLVSPPLTMSPPFTSPVSPCSPFLTSSSSTLSRSSLDVFGVTFPFFFRLNIANKLNFFFFFFFSCFSLLYERKFARMASVFWLPNDLRSFEQNSVQDYIITKNAYPKKTLQKTCT